MDTTISQMTSVLHHKIANGKKCRMHESVEGFNVTKYRKVIGVLGLQAAAPPSDPLAPIVGEVTGQCTVPRGSMHLSRMDVLMFSPPCPSFFLFISVSKIFIFNVYDGFINMSKSSVNRDFVCLGEEEEWS